MLVDLLLQLEKRSAAWLSAAVVLLLASCGGVDSGGTGNGYSAQATYSSGPITGFGSIVVNGVHYDESAATIVDDEGFTHSRDDLRLGMLAEVVASTVVTSGAVPTATAQTVRYGSQIIGLVDSTDVQNSRLVVLGQSVRVTATTVFDLGWSGGLATLAAGTLVEVYAQFDANARAYVATRIERKAVASNYKLRGVVGALSVAARTITIGGATISYAGVAPANPETALAPGAQVRVVLKPTRTADVWQATSLTTDIVRPADREAAEVDGRITAITSSSDFSLNGLPVDAANASFPNGRSGIVLGARVEVHGSIRNGVLVATKVELEGDEERGDFEVEGLISAPDAANKTFVVRGVTVVYSATTRFDSSTAADIVAGRKVSVKGTTSADGTQLAATSIHVER